LPAHCGDRPAFRKAKPAFAGGQIDAGRSFCNEPGELEAVRAAAELDGSALTGYPGERPPAYMVPSRHMVLRQLTRGVEGADGGI
jgi:hypothetical protein